MNYISQAMHELFYNLGKIGQKRGTLYVAPQTPESIKFRQDRAKAKRERRYATPVQYSRNDVNPGEPSRQVQRAQFRKEVKQGKRYRMLRERESRLIGRSDVAPSTLRIAAINAVSRLSRADIKKAA